MAALNSEYRGDIYKICKAMLTEWLWEKGLKPVTWATLTSAIAEAGQVALAEEINETLATATVVGGADVEAPTETRHPSDVIRSTPPIGKRYV